MTRIGVDTEKLDGLRANWLEATQQGNQAAMAFWGDVLADAIRNQHREKRGLDPIVTRWDRTAPERVVVETVAA